ncbi:MAG: DinB family protein [Gemmatimonadota bacterium]|jgi:uncharacterized damage-inducible protein DinB
MSDALGRDFAHILDRDLGRLADQIEAYPDDASVWRVGGTTKNAAGTLAVHLVGNLLHFVGAVLGETGYVRDRDREFSERGVPRAELLARIRACRETIRPVLEGLSDEALSRPYPGDLPPAMAGATTHRFLLHLSGHLTWHLGQVDYHRRLLADSGS